MPKSTRSGKEVDYDWKKVRWAIETFEDVIARNKEHLNNARLKREHNALEAIERHEQELLEAENNLPAGVVSLEEYWKTARSQD
jgi:hypothetical protein